jgi:hypothetical protein
MIEAISVVALPIQAESDKTQKIEATSILPDKIEAVEVRQ